MLEQLNQTQLLPLHPLQPLHFLLIPLLHSYLKLLRVLVVSHQVFYLHIVLRREILRKQDVFLEFGDFSLREGFYLFGGFLLFV